MDSARVLTAEHKHSANWPVALVVSSGKAVTQEPQIRGEQKQELATPDAASSWGT
jgi:hypothetical protein